MDTIATQAAITRRYTVSGMTCTTCARHIETAIERLPGVRSVRVDLATGTALVDTEEQPTSFDALRRAVADAGYTLEPMGRPAEEWRLPVRAILLGSLAAGVLLAFYLGLITLAQGWGHAVEQLIEDRWFVGAIASGFGTQVALFAYLRTLHARATAGGVAASTGTSTAAMLACCAHHLTDILPVIGLSGAAVFLNIYKTPLLWLGIGMNIVGIGYMLWQIRRQRATACALPAGPPESSAATPDSQASAAGCH